MARSFGVIKTQVWETGSEFRELELHPQWAYAMLVSQPTINNCGVLAYQPRKWQKLARGLTTATLTAALGALRQRLFVVVDEDSGELLVRTFIKHDRIWKQPNLITAARREYLTIESELLRGILAHQHPWLLNNDSTENVRKYEEQAKSKPLPEPLREGVSKGLPEPLTEPLPRARDAGARAHPLPPPTEPESVEEGKGFSDKAEASVVDSALGSTTTSSSGTRKTSDPDEWFSDEPKPGKDKTAGRRSERGERLPFKRKTAEAYVRNVAWLDPHPADALRAQYADIPDDDLIELVELAAELARAHDPSPDHVEEPAA